MKIVVMNHRVKICALNWEIEKIDSGTTVP
jgi:hypothetical protein